jgi:hypothetical protein
MDFLFFNKLYVTHFVMFKEQTRSIHTEVYVEGREKSSKQFEVPCSCYTFRSAILWCEKKKNNQLTW